ncbi:T9SS type A sorting domain-containing protein [Marivirga sp. S37H4]|uniref:T9SS type A sorting domain-containing protein n=1 Tax=Marivirga aurantiaca TaxID=2802615 RepID=A0A934X169_9BACT|nr:T9SS type A sorting domain-containing protein [Marivirga aurantiaca]MBK6266446.1 T9SS type A sorting domain-containing protein [Marivirga aurantiaca]
MKNLNYLSMRTTFFLLLFFSFHWDSNAQSLIKYEASQAGQSTVSDQPVRTITSHQYNSNRIDNEVSREKAGVLSHSSKSNLVDSLALVDLYLATNPGDSTWFNQSGWLTAPLNEWYGIGFDAAGRVNYLDLNNNNLTGTLPTSLADLSAIEQLYFYVNPNLSGDLFAILTNYPNLQRVSAHDCAFTGTILPEIFQDSLRELRLFNNQFSGSIPAEVANAPLMDQFNFSNNNLDGNIPNEITGLSRLFDLSLDQNNLNGEIPSEIGNLDSLLFLNLSGNSLIGSIPNSIGSLEKLTRLGLGENQLSGTIPTEIGQLSNLRELFLNQNQLTGEVPASLENLNALEIFILYQNKLEGSLPDILHLPALREFDVYGNGKLFVEIPDDLASLTNLRTFAIGATVANKGDFPEGFYQLVNLTRLDLGGQRFTGSLSDNVANWTSLDNIFLWQNELTGDLPEAFLNIDALRVVDISQNKIVNIPDFSATSLQQLFVVGNNLSFNSLVPNLNLPEFIFKNQNRIGEDQDIQLTLGESIDLTSEVQTEGEGSYFWVFNNDTIVVNQATLTVSNFNLSKAGSYSYVGMHPLIPDFFIRSGFINLKPEIEARSWYVDNRPGKTRDFNSLYQAIYASNANDTIYVSGSPQAYDTPGGLLLNSPRVILGPGYFLEDNPGNQFNTKPAVVADPLTINEGASGSQVYGLSFEAPIRLNNTFFTEGDTLRDVSFIGNRFLPGSNFGFVSHIDGLVFKGNYNSIFAFYSTDEPGAQSGLYAHYKNFDVSNNINIRIRPFNFQFSASQANNAMENILFSNNIIDTIANINDAVFEDNIIKAHSSDGNTFIGNVDYDESLFVNASGSLAIDNDYKLIDESLSKGPFSGDQPYVLSGLPPVPSIYDIIIGPRLSARVFAKTQDGNNINRLRYLYLRNNSGSNAFNVFGFTPTDNLDVEFLPNRSSLTPNESYEIVMVAIDASGKRSHRTYVPYTAIAASLSGKVVDINASDVTSGNVKLFAVNPFANKYDTAAVQSLNGSNSFNFENMILGDYIILADPSKSAYPDLIPTYLGNTIDWKVADTLFLQSDIENITIEVEKIPTPSSEPQPGSVSGFFEEEFEEADSSLRVLPRERVSGAGVSVRRISTSTRLGSQSLRLMEDDYELVAFATTDENGTYQLPNLPQGDYTIHFEYPGVEISETADIAFSISQGQSEQIEITAEVVDGLISVTQVVITSIAEQKPTTIKVFPNPARTYINFLIESPAKDYKLSILDVNGRTVKEIPKTNISKSVNIQDLPGGIYLLKLQDNNGNYYISKLSKQ